MVYSKHHKSRTKNAFAPLGRVEELGIRNEELGINVVGPLGEFCSVPHCRGRCQRLMGFALSGRSIERGVEIGSVRGLGC